MCQKEKQSKMVNINANTPLAMININKVITSIKGIYKNITQP